MMSGDLGCESDTRRGREEIEREEKGVPSSTVVGEGDLSVAFCTGRIRELEGFES